MNENPLILSQFVFTKFVLDFIQLSFAQINDNILVISTYLIRVKFQPKQSFIMYVAPATADTWNYHFFDISMRKQHASLNVKLIQSMFLS